MFGADLVVGVVSCASGTTFNLRTKMRKAQELGRGRAIVITHLDGENADFEETIMALREGVGAGPMSVGTLHHGRCRAPAQDQSA